MTNPRLFSIINYRTKAEFTFIFSGTVLFDVNSLRKVLLQGKFWAYNLPDISLFLEEVSLVNI